MGRTQRVTRRECSRIRSSSDARRQFLVFSTHPSSPSAESLSASVAAVHSEHELASIAVPSPSVTVMTDGDDPPQHIPQFLSVRSGQTYASSTVMPNQERLSVGNRNFANQTSPPHPDRAGPSDFHSLSDSWKSRLNTMSIKYKDSICQSTRVWKEKLFSRSTSMADIGCEVLREVNSGITTVSQMMEHLETRETHRDCISLSENPAVPSATEQSSHSNVGTQQQIP